MLESKVEARLKRLEDHGFKVLKLKTPGVSGVPDRMILRPKYAPGPPVFVELKRPGKEERPLQAAVRDDWRDRGVVVADRCSTYEQVDLLIGHLINIAEERNRPVPDSLRAREHKGPDSY